MSTSTLTEQGKQDRRLGIILATCCLSLFVVGVDVTIVNIALPSIQRSFGASTAGLQWTIDAYTVVLASLLMLSGSLADRLGRRRVFQAGLALFTLGSLLCSLAPGLGWLGGVRVVPAGGGCSRPGWRCSRSARCCAVSPPGSAGWSGSGCSRRSAGRCSTPSRWR